MSILQVIWFLLVGVLLTGYAILDGFDLGVGFWHLFTKKQEHRDANILSVGPVWDGNEVWLLTGGGALFAAFPPVYACSFSGFYLAMMLVLLGLIFRAVSIEFRHQIHSQSWQRKWDLAFGLGSTLPALLYGVALGNIVRGLELDAAGNYTAGFFALLNPYALLVGLTGLAMFATHGAVWIALKTSGEQNEQARAWAAKSWAVWLVLFLGSSAWSLAAHVRGSIALPLVAAVVALAALVTLRQAVVSGKMARAFVASSVAIAAHLGAVGATLFPNMIPATNDPSLSLTVWNASSSANTLTVMTVLAALGMPLVIGYTIWVYRLFAGKVDLEGEEY
jgi:cytochrome bd ubiquinol oxidase subunit II